jgi:hypothetical protein
VPLRLDTHPSLIYRDAYPLRTRFPSEALYVRDFFLFFQLSIAILAVLELLVLIVSLPGLSSLPQIMGNTSVAAILG